VRVHAVTPRPRGVVALARQIADEVALEVEAELSARSLTLGFR
jgi:hypothetical protein